MAQDREQDVLRQVDELLTAAVKLNHLFPDAILVGGTASAVYAKHRLSNDTDFVVPGLKEHFNEVIQRIDADENWTIARMKAPVMVMGNFHGVETTLRQLIRTRPLETTEVEVGEGKIRVPTLDEMIRIKAWLVLSRNAYRDYLDLAALSDVAGRDRTAAILESFDGYYADVDNKSIVRGVSPLLQLTRQLFEPLPVDLEKTSELERYKGVSERWSSPEAVLAKCREIGLLAADFALVPDVGVENDLELVGKAKGEPTEPAIVPPYPEGTHKACISQDGSTVIIRKRDGSGPYDKVDNPLGPAVVSPKGDKFALDGRFMSEAEWKQHVELSTQKDYTS